jgi:G:T-mismatch repair DNA endonuclease (very short patch repair protein)
MEIFEATKEQIEKICNEKMTWVQAGILCNTHANTVRYFFKKNKIKKPSLSKMDNFLSLTDEDKQYIIDNFDSYSLRFFNEKFDLSEKFIRRFCKDNNLDYKSKRRIMSPLVSERCWTVDEIDFLKNNFHLDLLEISNKIGKSEIQIEKKMWSLNIPCQKISVSWSKYEDDFLKRHFQKPISYLSFYLERTDKAIIHRLSFLKLNSNTSKYTNIEIVVKNIFDKHNIKYMYDTRISNNAMFRPDFYLKEKNLIVECYGDYWHCNPEIVLELTPIQEIKVAKDIEKQEFYKNEGFNLLIFWESDILSENFEEILLLKINQYA